MKEVVETKKQNELFEKVKSFSGDNLRLASHHYLKLKIVRGSFIVVDTSKISSTKSGFDSGDPFLYNGKEKGIFIGLFRQMGISAWIVAFEKHGGKVQMVGKGEQPLKSLQELGFEKVDE